MPGASPLLAADPGRIGRYRLAGRLNGHSAGSRRPDGRPVSKLWNNGVAPFVVYLGRAANGEPVTVTLLQPLRADDTAARDRFMAEANAAREVAPFCVARMLDAGFHGDFPYLVSEHIPGPSLEELIAAEGPPEEGVLRAIAIGAATGLAAIHQAGLVHGHFGPHLLVLGPDGPRVVHSGVTPPYGLATPAADVLSWARAMLFAATGTQHPDMIAPAPSELRPLRSPIRQLVAESAARDPAGRPPAKVIVTRLLGHAQPPAGILAAGSRSAVLARIPVRADDTAAAAGAGAAGESTRGAAVRGPALQRVRLTGRMAAVAAVAVALAVAIVVVTAILALGHHGSSQASPRPSPSAAAKSPAASPASPAPTPVLTAGLPIPSSLDGTWSGQLQQNNPPLSVAAQLQFTTGQRSGTISYPSFGCSGMLLLTSQSATSYVFTQGIVSGQQTCGQGTVTLRRNGSGLSFTFAPATSGGPGIYGTLSHS